ncbi:hypothetical protein HMPREF9477_01529 [Lachnospiraceae bacterium 2_1_46FAA]|nr:hypothetical protein HMPREF9477_01529 [Lachnospiraceae bacterium 2_1_46FAA]
MNERDRREQIRRRRYSRKRRQRSLVIKVCIFIILALVVLCGTILWKKYSPSDKKANRKEYYGITNEEQLAVIVNNQILEPKGKMIDGTLYLEYSAVRDYVNERFYWDANENLLLYTLPNDMVSVSVGSREYAVSKEKKSEEYVILKTEGSTAYIALDFVKKYTDIEYKMYKSPNRIVIQSDWSDAKVATTKNNSAIRMRAGVKSPILTETKSDDVVRIIEKEGKWRKVRTNDGFVGYIKQSDLKDEKTKTYKREFKEEKFTNIKKDYTINMAWHQVSSRSANNQVLEMIANTKGLTTLSPTWFSVKDTKGNITSIASSEYVNYAHQSNIEVWGLVRNFDPLNQEGIKTSEETHELLSRTSSRENLTNQLISEALQVGLDGINVDFETVAEKTGEHYIQFIRELSVKCRKNGIVLSVDNYVPKGYNEHYHRKEQGIVADYVIIMGYDEHFAGSYESGSVASIGYVKEGIQETLKDVPASKVINAMPLYTRLWKEVPKTEAELSEQAGTEAGKYSTKVTSETVSMKRTDKVLEQFGAEAKWDSKTGQNYAQWEKDDATYKIWLEDEKSIEEKLKVMKANKLAGTAVWKLGFESQGLWELILKYVN